LLARLADLEPRENLSHRLARGLVGHSAHAANQIVLGADRNFNGSTCPTCSWSTSPNCRLRAPSEFALMALAAYGAVHWTARIKAHRQPPPAGA
jgi:hypothetical protein